MHTYYRFWEEVWYFLEQQSGTLWLRFCPLGKASYWLDFLPAYCARQYYAAI